MITDIFTLSAIVVGVTQAFKLAFQVTKKWLPLLNIGLAIGIGGTAGFFGLTELTIDEALVAGLVAAGLWDLGKNPVVAIVKSLTKKSA